MYWKLIASLAILLIVLLIYNHVQTSHFFIKRITLESQKLTDCFRITQITDYHANDRIDLNKLIGKIGSFNPHIIALTGDIIDSKTDDIKGTLIFVERLSEVNPNIYFVIGNHELANRNGDRFILELEKLGVHVLDNNKELVAIEGNRVNVCGLNFHADRGDYEKLMGTIDKDNYTLLLSHSPNELAYYSQGTEDLIIAGHTHGGQVRVPLIGALIAPGQGLFPKYDKGIFNVKGTTLYIDSGLGNSIMPLRLFNRVQISNISIKPYKNKSISSN